MCNQQNILCKLLSHSCRPAGSVRGHLFNCRMHRLVTPQAWPNYDHIKTWQPMVHQLERLLRTLVSRLLLM